MEKRECQRFYIPGTTLFYKKHTRLGHSREYPDEYFPVVDISRGGLRFLSNERPKTGLPLTGLKQADKPILWAMN